MRAYDVAFSPDPRWGRWQYGQRVKGLPLRCQHPLSPNYLRGELLTVDDRDEAA